MASRASDVLGGDAQANEPPVDLKVVHAKIGQLALENDFLEGALIEVCMLKSDGDAMRRHFAATH